MAEIDKKDHPPADLADLTHNEDEPSKPQSNYEYLNLPVKSTSSSSKTYLIYLLTVGALALIAGLIYVGLQFKTLSILSKPNIEKKTTEQAVTSPTPVSSASVTPAPTLAKADLKIQILNGSGISGQAATVKDLMSKKGYTNIVIGNSSASNVADASIAFSAKVSEDHKHELKSLLESVFAKVTQAEASSGATFDVTVITGSKLK